MNGFDPYHTWLGIPKADQPPTHYRLLGIQPFESDPQVIDNAADRLMIHLRTFSAGPNGPLSQKLLNEVAAARSTLQTPQSKAAYDAKLRAKLQADRPPPQARQVVAQPIYVPVHMPVPMPPMPVEAPPPSGMRSAQVPASAGFEPAAAAAPVSFAVSGSSSSRRGRRKADGGAAGAAVGLIKVIVGGLGGISIAVLGVWIFARSDPFGLFTEKDNSGTVAAVAPASTSPAVTPTVTSTQPKATTTPKAIDATKSGTAKSTPTAVPKSVDPETTSPTQAPEPSSTDQSSPNTTPSEATTEPAEPMADPEPTPTPTPAATVASLAEVPSNEAQQAKLTELKQLYKTEFDQGLKPAGREPFIDFLLGTADKLKSDPVARFVLLREAYSRLVGLKEFPSAAEVVDRLDAEFAMDPFKLRLHLLTEASAAAKQPAERLGIARCASELVEQAIVRQRIGEAEKLVRIAEGQARALSDNELRAKMTAQKLEVEKLAARWGPVERARQKLEKEPNDPDAAALDGRYRCLVEGDWNTGLPLLARSSDSALAQPAQQDQAASGDDAAALGDQWFDIAASNKDFLGFYARARHWYRQAVAAAPAVEKERLNRRIEQIDAMSLPPRLLAASAPATAEPLPLLYVAFSQMQAFEPVDLMKYIAGPELGASAWSGNNGSLMSRSMASYARIPAHYPPPREYQVIVNVQRVRFFSDDGPPKIGPFIVGLVGPKTQFLAAIDVPSGDEFSTALSLANATEGNGTSLVKTPFASIPDDGRDVVVICEVRRRSVTVRVNGTAVCRYEGDLEKLVLPKDWSVSDIRAPFIGSQNSTFRVESWRLAPLDPESRLGPAESTPALGAPGFSTPAAAGPSTDGFFNRP